MRKIWAGGISKGPNLRRGAGGRGCCCGGPAVLMPGGGCPAVLGPGCPGAFIFFAVERCWSMGWSLGVRLVAQRWVSILSLSLWDLQWLFNGRHGDDQRFLDMTRILKGCECPVGGVKRPRGPHAWNLQAWSRTSAPGSRLEVALLQGLCPLQAFQGSARAAWSPPPVDNQIDPHEAVNHTANNARRFEQFSNDTIRATASFSILSSCIQDI